MPEKERNSYQTARKSAGMTQERAAEVLYTSVESLKAYETGQRLPPNFLVVRMTEAYGAPWLAVEHLRKISAPLGVLPDIRVQGLPTAVLAFINRCADLKESHRDLMRIAEDGVIDEAERPKFEAIAGELAQLIAAAYQVMYPLEDKKEERPVGGTTKRSVSATFVENDCKNIISQIGENARTSFEREGGASR